MIVLSLLGVLVIYLLIAAFATKVIVSRADTAKGKWLAGICSLLVFALIPLGDVIVGRLYFQYLCESEAQAAIYKVAPLEAKYYDKRGDPAFVWNGRVYELGNRYRMVIGGNDYTRSALHIEKRVVTVSEIGSGEPMGELTDFLYFGGWLENATGLKVSGASCPNIPVGRRSQFIRQLFTKTEP